MFVCSGHRHKPPRLNYETTCYNQSGLVWDSFFHLVEVRPDGLNMKEKQHCNYCQGEGYICKLNGENPQGKRNMVDLDSRVEVPVFNAIIDCPKYKQKSQQRRSKHGPNSKIVG